MLLFSNNLSTIATISSLNISELLLACFSCKNNFNLLQSSSGWHDEKTVEIPEAMTAGDLSNFISVLSRVDLLPWAFMSKFISSAKSYIDFLSCKLARSTLNFSLFIIFNKSPFNSKSLPLSRNVNKFLYKVFGIVLFFIKSLTLFELESFTRLKWPEFSGLVSLDKGDIKKVDNIPLSFNISRSLLFKFSLAWLLLIEFSVLVFVISWEVFSIDLVTGS